MKKKVVYGSLIAILMVIIGFMLNYILNKENYEMNEREQVQLLMDVIGCEEEDTEMIFGALERAKVKNIRKAEAMESHLTGCFGLKVTDSEEQKYIIHYRKNYLVAAIQEDSIEGDYIYKVIK